MLGSKIFTYISGVTSTVQLYLLPVGLLPSTCVISGCAAFGGLRYMRQLLQYPWFWFTCILYLAQMASLLWSPNHRMGARVLVYQMPFIFLSLAMVNLAQENRRLALRIIKISLAATAVQAFFVILFRLLPRLKIGYLASPFAYPFNSINRLQDVFERVGTSNILDATKSGGLITYANPTAAWLGLAAIAAWYFGQYYKSRLLLFVALADFVAIFFTGSKSGAVVALGLVGLACIMDATPQIINYRRLDSRYVIAACLGLSVIAAAIPFVLEISLTAHFLNESSSTLASRQELWDVARQEFAVHPIRGLGFGGWELVVPRTGRGLGLPPHNAFVLLWAQSGVFASLLGIGFSISFLVWAYQRAVRGSPEESMVAKAVFGGFLCLLILTQGENFGLFGDEHMRPLLALLAGFLAAIKSDAGEIRREALTKPAGELLPTAATERLGVGDAYYPNARKS
jgi:O-antigen ligase